MGDTGGVTDSANGAGDAAGNTTSPGQPPAQSLQPVEQAVRNSRKQQKANTDTFDMLPNKRTKEITQLLKEQNHEK